MIQARLNCEKSGNTEWFEKWSTQIQYIEDNVLPSGSGIDNGTKIDLEASTGEKIVLNTSFHHMTENGFYDGWTDHTVTVTASLIHDIKLKISGRDRNDIKEYLHQEYESVLTEDYDEVHA
jgi:hypothetical protein